MLPGAQQLSGTIKGAPTVEDMKTRGAVSTLLGKDKDVIKTDMRPKHSVSY